MKNELVSGTTNYHGIAVLLKQVDEITFDPEKRVARQATKAALGVSL